MKVVVDIEQKREESHLPILIHRFLKKSQLWYKYKIIDWLEKQNHTWHALTQPRWYMISGVQYFSHGPLHPPTTCYSSEFDEAYYIYELRNTRLPFMFSISSEIYDSTKPKQRKDAKRIVLTLRCSLPCHISPAMERWRSCAVHQRR